MAKKSKRSRGTQKKKNRASQAPSSQAAISQRSSQLAGGGASAARNLDRASSPPDSARASDRPSAPESSTRVRSSDPILPPPREASPSDPSADEISIPPVQAPADLEDSFFGKRFHAEKAEAHEEEEDLRHSLDPRSLQKMSPAAHARRAHLTRYVKGFVVAAAVLGAAGLLRVAVKGKPSFEPPPPIVHTAVAAVAQGPVQHDIQGFAPGQNPSQAAAPADPQNQAAAPQGDTAAAAQPQGVDPTAAQGTPSTGPGTTETTAAQAAAPVAAQPATPPAAAAQPAAPTTTDAPAKSALEEKKDASRLLERGKNKEAIEAGERSVALDPTDGEAWLVLGAAYQQVGKNADAKKAFQSCLKEGKRGPIGECRAMLQ